MKKLLVILMLLSAACAFAQNPTAVIRELSGTVEIKKSADADWALAKTGDIVEKSTFVSTGFKSMAVLTLGNSTLIVRALTRLNLGEIIEQHETETISVNLNTGRVRADVSPPSGKKTSFSIVTPAATASVRGTSFEMDGMSIKVLSGTVGYKPAAGTSSRPVILHGGQESWIDRDTGNVFNPRAAADTGNALPRLPGPGMGKHSGGGGKFNSAPQQGEGTFTIDITLEGKVGN